MRFFIVTQTFPPAKGGMEATMYALAQHLTAKQHAVSVLPNKPYENPEAFAVVNRRYPKFLRATMKRRWLARQVRADDVVICDSWKSVAAVPKTASRIVVMAHGQEYLKTGGRAVDVQNALDRATHLVASSDFTLGLVCQGWQTQHLAKSTISPTYMLPDLAATPNATAQNAGQCLEIISLCRLEARKGLKQTMTALAHLEPSDGGWHWSICGAGPQEGELKQLSRELGLDDKISFLGRVDDDEKDRLLAAADLFVMPSYQDGGSLEGFGISYIEAARAGLACVAGRSGGAAEAVIDGTTGWSVDAQNQSQLRAVLKEAMGNPAERAKRGKAAQDMFQQKMAGHIVFGKFLDHISTPHP